MIPGKFSFYPALAKVIRRAADKWGVNEELLLHSASTKFDQRTWDHPFSTFDNGAGIPAGKPGAYDPVLAANYRMKPAVALSYDERIYVGDRWDKGGYVGPEYSTTSVYSGGKTMFGHFTFMGEENEN